MNNQALIERLEKIVAERTLLYKDADGRFRYDEKLMKCSYVLAKIYLMERYQIKARVHLRTAERQLVCFNETFQEEIKPVNMAEEKKCPPYDLERLLKSLLKKEREKKKFHRWTKKIFKLGDNL